MIHLLSCRIVTTRMRRFCSFTGHLGFTLIRRTRRFCPFITRRQSRTGDYQIKKQKTMWCTRWLQLQQQIFLSLSHAVSSSESSSVSLFLNIGGREGPINACDSIIKPNNPAFYRQKKLHHKREEPGRRTTTSHPETHKRTKSGDGQPDKGIWSYYHYFLISQRFYLGGLFWNKHRNWIYSVSFCQCTLDNCLREFDRTSLGLWAYSWHVSSRLYPLKSSQNG